MTTIAHTRPYASRPHRPGLRAWIRLCVCEAKMTARDTAGLVVPFALPILILVMSASGASSAIVFAGRTALDLVVLPLVCVMISTMIGVLNMPSFLASYRRSGVLKRLATTPLSPFMVLAAQVVVSFVQAALGIGIAYVVAVTVFGANPPHRIAAAVGVLLATMLAMYAIGMVVAAVAPTPNSAVAIGLVGFLGLGALGGMFGPRDALPDWVARIGDALPFGAGVDALGAAWAGQPIDAANLLSLTVTIVVGAAVSALFFRWE